MATIKDVAKLAGVSHGTVSNVLNGNVRVSKDKVDKIQNAIKELGYVPTAAARNLKTKKSMNIAVILPFVTDQHYALVFNGIEKTLSESGYFVSLYITNENPKKELDLIEMVMQQRVDGIIACLCSPVASMSKIRELKEDLPVCLLERDIKLKGIGNNFHKYSFIGYRNKDTIIEILHFYRKLGKKNFSLICGPSEFSSEGDCLNGFIEDHYKYNTQSPPHIIITDNNKESGFRGAVELFQSSFIPEVVICTSKPLAVSTEKALEYTAGYLSIIPEIIDFGDETWIAEEKKKINVFRRSITAGEKAAENILENLENPVFFEEKKLYLDNSITYHNEIELPTQSSKSQKPVLKLAMLEDQFSKALFSIIKDFELKHNCRTDLYEYSYDELYDTVMGSGSTEFDILQIDLPWLEESVQKGKLMDLNNFLLDMEEIDQRSIPGSLENYALVNGSYHAIPFIFGSQLLFYRKDLFEDKALQNSYYSYYKEELQPPRNWSEFNAIARFFTRKYNPESPVTYGTTLGGQDSSGAVCEVLPRIWGFGGDVFDSKGNIILDRDPTLKGIRNYCESYQYAPEGSADYWWKEQVEIFSSGEAAMMVLFVAHATTLTNRQHSNIVGRIGYEILPGETSLMGGWSLGIQPESKHTELGFQFLKWISSKETAIPYMILGGSNPSNYLYKSSELNFIYPWLEKSLESFHKSRKRIIPKSLGENLSERQFEKIMGRHINSCIKKRKTPEETIKKIVSELHQTLGKTNS